MKHRTIALSLSILPFTAHAADLSGNFISEENPALRLALERAGFSDNAKWVMTP